MTEKQHQVYIQTMNGDYFEGEQIIKGDYIRGNQININGSSHKKQEEKSSAIPYELKTSVAEEVLNRLMDADLMDEDWQPLVNSKQKQALLANQICLVLQIDKPWSLFAKLWSVDSTTLRRNYERAKNSTKMQTFLDEVKRSIGSL